MTSPISMCLIVRDEPLLEEALASVRPYVQEIVVVVTSARDAASIETAKKFGAVVEVDEECNRCVHGIPGLLHDQCPGEGVLDDRIWDYAKARNRSLDLATQPWLMWMDADDLIVGMEKLAEVLQWAEIVRQGRDVSVHFPYEYSFTDQGQCNMLLSRERLLHGKHAWRWMDPIHEIIVPVTGVSLGEDQRLVWKHQRHRSKGPIPREGTRNLRILRKTYAERSADPRVIFYFANALKDDGRLAEAIDKYAEYLPKSGNDDERAIACIYAAKLSLALGKFEDAVEWGLRCVSIQESWGEGYFLCCQAFYLLAQRKDWRERRYWEKCVYFGLEGLKRPPTKTALFIDPTVRAYEIHLWLHFARNAIGDLRGAVESTGAALESRPDDTQTRYNRLIYEEAVARADAIDALHRMLGANRALRDEFKHARPPDLAYEALEKGLNHPQDVWDAMGRVEAQRAAGMANGGAQAETVTNGGTQDGSPGLYGGTQVDAHRLDIVIACGDCWEVWSPRTAEETGIGGSETAVIEVSKRLAARGHRVRVFTSCIPGNYWDCEWRPIGELNSVSKCDILIAWRNAPLLELPIGARIRWLWVHDVYAVGATLANIARADRVLALSEWHKGFMLQHHAPHGLTAEKVLVTRNGIDFDRFDAWFALLETIPRDPHKCVYSSSWDRGLESLLQMWPRILVAVPDAKLHVFYGSANWEKMATQSGDSESIQRIKVIKAMMASLGVFDRGRVNGRTLAKEFLSAGVWAYPTWFSETSCVTAMEAQAAGLFIVTSPIAALNDTVGNRGAMIPGNYMTQEYQDRFVAAVIDTMTPGLRLDRPALQQYAREHFSWDGVVDQWEREWGLEVEAQSKRTMPMVETQVPTASAMVQTQASEHGYESVL